MFETKDFDIYNSVSLYRKMLSENENDSVCIIGIGPLNTLASLLKSKPDAYSSLDGISLVRQKVTEIYIMMGHFPTNGENKYLDGKLMKSEWNVLQDIESAQYFMKNTPVPTNVLPFEIGLIKTGHNLFKQQKDSPVKLAYETHNNGKPRESWDPITIYIAINGTENLWGLSTNGTILIDDKGVTTFIENQNGLHRIINQKGKDEDVRDLINSFLY